VWALIHVTAGELRYVVDGLDGRQLKLRPGVTGTVAPGVVHHVEVVGPVRFHVEFHHRPGGTGDAPAL
jgi:tellurite methyltransferase